MTIRYLTVIRTVFVGRSTTIGTKPVASRPRTEPRP
jgi:hypothetical protein